MSTNSLPSRTTSIAKSALWITRPSKPDSLTNTLLPPPITQIGTPLSAAHRTHSTVSDTDNGVANRRAGPPTPNVVSDEKETLDSQ